MRSLFRLAVLAFTIFYTEDFSFAQGNKTVMWQFEAASTANREVILKFTALVMQGWHLYSQHMGESGPMPTRFSFEGSEDYILIGQPNEIGNAVRFYDEDYATEITWYTGTVTFIQKVQLVKPITSVRGSVQYMTCNDHSCIPSKQDFKIEILPRKKS